MSRLAGGFSADSLNGRYGGAPKVRAMSAASTPSSSRRLSRAVSPATTRTAERGIFKALARKVIKAALAAPSTGGLLTRTFR